MFKNLTKKQIIIIVAVAVVIVSIIIYLVIKRKKKKAQEKSATIEEAEVINLPEPPKKFEIIPEQDKKESEAIIEEVATEVVEKKRPSVKNTAPVKPQFKPLMEEDMEAFNNLKEGEGLGAVK